MSRIASRFTALKNSGKKAFIPFVTAGYPDLATFADILARLPKAGCDLIEIGIPFSDPMADGPVIEKANLKAFAEGITLQKTLDIVTEFRKKDKETPIIFMGYANPIYAYGLKKFVEAAKSAGVDGLILPDLPPEEDGELRPLASTQGIDMVRLLASTTDAKRLPVILKGANGFLYYVSVTGTTGDKQANAQTVKAAIDKIRPHTQLPIAVGFGISTPEKVKEIAAFADAIVVGTAIVNCIGIHSQSLGVTKSALVEKVIDFVETLAQAAHKS